MGGLNGPLILSEEAPQGTTWKSPYLMFTRLPVSVVSGGKFGSFLSLTLSLFSLSDFRNLIVDPVC